MLSDHGNHPINPTQCGCGTTSITALSRNFLEDIKRVRDTEVIVRGILRHPGYHDVYA
jgi:hypothetical protein